MSVVTQVRLVTAIAISAALAAGCSRSSPEEESAGSGAFGVSTVVVRSQTLRDTANVSGTVVPSTLGDWTVTAPEPGEVAELPKALGDDVAIGDILVRFNIASVAQELAARELAVTEASSRVESARSEILTQQGLFERGLAPRNAVENARVAMSGAETTLSHAQAELEAAKVAESRAVVRARFPGKVTMVYHAVGDQVRPGTDDPVLRVIDPTRLQVSVQIPIAQLARVFPGQTAVVRAIAGVGDEAATVAIKPETTDPNVATGEVRLSFVQPTASPLDTPVSVEILLDQRTNALVVPTAAVLRDDLSPYVVVADDSRRARRRDVRLGLSTTDLTQITNGLAPGERVITSGLTEISEGMEVAFAE